jgi:hypothetical protein
VFSLPDESPDGRGGEHAEHRVRSNCIRTSPIAFGADVDVTDAFRQTSGRVDMTVLPSPGEAYLALHLFLHASAAMLDRGLRLAQVLDFAFVASDAATQTVVRERLGDAAWAVVHLLARDVPGVLAPAWMEASDAARPSRLRQRVILSRPGLLQGDRTAVDAGGNSCSQGLAQRIDRVRRLARPRLRVTLPVARELPGQNVAAPQVPGRWRAIASRRRAFAATPSSRRRRRGLRARGAEMQAARVVVEQRAHGCRQRCRPRAPPASTPRCCW